MKEGNDSATRTSSTVGGERIFGTDGIRGRAGEGWLSAESVSALGAAIGTVLARHGEPHRVLLGHDGRRSGSQLEKALAGGFATSGLEVVSAGLIPTPGLAVLTRALDFDLAVMISASHNPASDNGLKVFDGRGEKLSDPIEIEIEKTLRSATGPCPAGSPPPLDGELELAYLAHLLDGGGRDLKLDGLTLVIDCANGGASRVGPRVLGRLGAQVIAICAEPDGENINRDCGSTHPAALQEEVRKQGAQVGIALDGDGDRCMLVDEQGGLVHGDGVLTLVARHAVETGALPDPRIVATVMSNRGLHRALREVGVSVITVGVGDRQVVECLRREGLTLGGEQSGHIVFGADNGYVGDGLYTALRVLRVLVESGRPLSALAAPYRPFPQVLLNVPVARKPCLTEIPAATEAVKSIEQELGEDGRVLLRYSGTEPLIRVMVEGPDAEMIQARAQSLADLIAGHIGI